MTGSLGKERLRAGACPPKRRSWHEPAPADCKAPPRTPSFTIRDKESRHPRYQYLEKWPDQRIKEIGAEAFLQLRNRYSLTSR